MKLEIKLEDWKSCKGCPCHIYKPRPDSGGLIPSNRCLKGYDSYSKYSKGFLNHKLIRPKKCIQDNEK